MCVYIYIYIYNVYTHCKKNSNFMENNRFFFRLFSFILNCSQNSVKLSLN